MKFSNQTGIAHTKEHQYGSLFRYLILAAIGVVCYASCKKEELDKLDFVTAVTVRTVVEDIDKIRLFGSIDGIDGALSPADYPRREYGFLLTESTEAATLGADGVEKISLGSDFLSNLDFDTLLSGLSLQKVFFFRAFVLVGERVSYGNIQPFSLSDNLVVGLSDSVRQVNNRAELKGVLVLRFQQDITDHGFILSKSNPFPTIEDNDLKLPLGPTNDDGEFRALIDSLEFNSCYYVRAYGQVNQDYIYNEGPSVAFATRDGWKRVALLEDRPLFDAMAGAVNGTAYFGMGCTEVLCYPTQTQTFVHVWKLDLTRDTLVDAGLPGASGRRGGVSFTIGNKIYFGLGYYVDPNFSFDFPVYQNDLWFFDPNNGWQEITTDPFPGPLRQDAVAVSLKGKAYIGLGTDRLEDAFLDDFWVFNPDAGPGDRWQPFDAKLPWRDEASGQDNPSGRTDAIAFAWNERVYAGCGQTSGFGLNDLWSINPETNDAWQWEASGNFLNRRKAIAFSVNDKAYIGMGETSQSAPIYSLWELSSNRGWIEKEPFPTPETARDKTIPQLAIPLNGKVYIGGPNTDYISFDVWEYTPDEERMDCQ
ncbi:MAG: hypothetical protein H6573_27770 [Lewinellaceae bacterium]|nr:hypothetical protein [Phaeodactylibacter sp.]MCB0614632.1 hypothetical protein [Phaeodactylibacter sp.]MCB9351267.1 hypothetical protein [Lewinellaceae bacterium]